MCGYLRGCMHGRCMSTLKAAGGEATESRERIVGETAEVGVRKKGIGFQEEAGRHCINGKMETSQKHSCRDLRSL